MSTNTRQRADRAPACMMNDCNRPAEPERLLSGRVIPASETELCSKCSYEADSYEGAVLSEGA